MSNGWIEWAVWLKCKKCGRQSSKYLRTSRNEKKAIGCKDCGLHTVIEIRERTYKAGDLEINVYIPFYC